MSKLYVMNVNYDNVYAVVKDAIYSCIIPQTKLDDTKFHHQLDIEKVPSAIEHGILSYKLYKKNVDKKELTEKEKYIFSDDSHVNGLDCISLSTMEIDLDKMYENEMLWGTYSTISPDIIVSKKVNPFHVTSNYYNEFLVSDMIPVEMFNSIDVRLLRIINYNFFLKEQNLKENRVKILLKYYEGVRNIALEMKKQGLDIPLREVSSIKGVGEDDKALTLDKDMVINLPKLILK